MKAYRLDDFKSLDDLRLREEGDLRLKAAMFLRPRGPGDNQLADFSSDHCDEFVRVSQRLNLSPRDDDQPDFLEKIKSDELMSGFAIFGTSGYAIHRDQNPKIKASMLDLGKEPIHFLATHSL